MLSKKTMLGIAAGVLGAALLYGAKDKSYPMISDRRKGASVAENHFSASDRQADADSFEKYDNQKKQILKNVEDLRTQLAGIEGIINKLK